MFSGLGSEAYVLHCDESLPQSGLGHAKHHLGFPISRFEGLGLRVQDLRDPF